VTVHLMTVGNSIREHLEQNGRAMHLASSLRSGRGLLDSRLLLGQEHAEPQEANAFLSALARDPADERTASALRAARLGPNDTDSQWRSTASAEATSLRAVTGEHRVRHEDLVVLLATDTVPGLLSAFWNAAFLLGGDLQRLSYLEAPGGRILPDGAGNGPAARGRVLLARIPGMDMRDPARFDEAMAGLGTIARTVLDALGTDPPEKVAVHLSGGYKATLPFLLGITEGMRSVLAAKDPSGRGADRVAAHVTHEENLSADRPQAVGLPLRRFPLDAVHSELGYFDEHGADPEGAIGQDTENGLLLGYAYDLVPAADGDLWRLTPFGHGLRTLIGPAPRTVT